MRIKVYIAGPYTKGDPCVNTNIAVKVGQALWDSGFCPFVPHLTHFWHTMIPNSYEMWMDYDMEWMRKCDAVLRLPGVSSGADKEIAEAIELGIPVFTDIEDLRDHFLGSAK